MYTKKWSGPAVLVQLVWSYLFSRFARMHHGSHSTLASKRRGYMFFVRMLQWTLPCMSWEGSARACAFVCFLLRSGFIYNDVCSCAPLICQHCFHEMQELTFQNMQEQDSPVLPLKNMKDLFWSSALTDVFYTEKCPQLECIPCFIAVVKWTLKLWFIRPGIAFFQYYPHCCIISIINNLNCLFC